MKDNNNATLKSYLVENAYGYDRIIGKKRKVAASCNQY